MYRFIWFIFGIIAAVLFIKNYDRIKWFIIRYMIRRTINSLAPDPNDPAQQFNWQ